MTIERILGTDTRKTAFEKADRNFVTHETQINNLANYGEFGISTGQSIASSDITKIVLNTTVKSSDLFELQANGDIKVLQDGVYEILGQVIFQGATNDIIVMCYLYANNIEVGMQSAKCIQDLAYWDVIQASSVYALSTGGIIQLKARKDSTSARTVLIAKLVVRKVG